jgi:hypothetical protein
MGAGTLISLEEYLRTSYRPECDYVDGEVQARNVGQRRHAYAQGKIASWCDRHKDTLHLEPLPLTWASK